MSRNLEHESFRFAEGPGGSDGFHLQLWMARVVAQHHGQGKDEDCQGQEGGHSAAKVGCRDVATGIMESGKKLSITALES